MPYPKKPADAHPDLVPAIRDRWSPVRFDAADDISDDELRLVLEAARWAPSSFNEQPWRFLCARRNDAHRGPLEAALFDGNAYAKRASALVCTLAKSTLSRNGRTNRLAPHDVGLATMNLVIQATSMGLISHLMAGFDKDRIRHDFRIPDDFTPLVMIALGRHDPALTGSDMTAREDDKQRTRSPLDELVYGSAFGASLNLS